MYKVVLFIALCFFVLYFSFYSKNKTLPFKPLPFFENEKWVTCDVQKDGSCFYHAVLFLISKTYRNTNISLQTKMSQDLRHCLKNTFTYDIWKNSYSQYERFSTIQNNLLHEWAGNIEWKITADYLDIQIVIFRQNTSSLYWGFEENILPNQKRTIFILNIDDNHFEPIFYRKAESYQYIFHMNTQLHSFLKKIKCKN